MREYPIRQADPRVSIGNTVTAYALCHHQYRDRGDRVAVESGLAAKKSAAGYPSLAMMVERVRTPIAEPRTGR
jgi:hypothetical protein